LINLDNFIISNKIANVPQEVKVKTAGITNTYRIESANELFKIVIKRKDGKTKVFKDFNTMLSSINSLASFIGRNVDVDISFSTKTEPHDCIDLIKPEVNTISYYTLSNLLYYTFISNMNDYNITISRGRNFNFIKPYLIARESKQGNKYVVELDYIRENRAFKLGECIYDTKPGDPLSRVEEDIRKIIQDYLETEIVRYLYLTQRAYDVENKDECSPEIVYYYNVKKETKENYEEKHICYDAVYYLEDNYDEINEKIDEIKEFFNNWKEEICALRLDLEDSYDLTKEEDKINYLIDLYFINSEIIMYNSFLSYFTGIGYTGQPSTYDITNSVLSKYFNKDNTEKFIEITRLLSNDINNENSVMIRKVQDVKELIYDNLFASRDELKKSLIRPKGIYYYGIYDDLTSELDKENLIALLPRYQSSREVFKNLLSNYPTDSKLVVNMLDFSVKLMSVIKDAIREQRERVMNNEELKKELLEGNLKKNLDYIKENLQYLLNHPLFLENYKTLAIAK